MNDEQLENARNSSDQLIFDLADAVVKLRVELRIARQSRDRLRAALTEIAAYDDNGANARLAYSGSYSSFDEPGSVQIARKALEKEG